MDKLMFTCGKRILSQHLVELGVYQMLRKCNYMSKWYQAW